MKALILFSLFFGMSFGSPSFAEGMPASMPLTGKILESIDANSYTYLKLNTDKGEVWSAVPKGKFKIGNNVQIENPLPMKDFESKALKRKFPSIIFGTVAQAGEQAPVKDKAADKSTKSDMGAPHSGKKQPAAFNLKSIKIKALSGPDGKTVAQVYEEKASLKDKVIRVRAKVVKFLPMIMGKNWIHVSDGTGSLEAKNFDLSITSPNAVAKVGDTVIVQGKVTVDQDLGSGYLFSVLIQEATITPDSDK